MAKPNKILIAPMDWGLGHATRCIPLITGLLAEGCTVFIAADGAIRALLQQEFPGLTFFDLMGYKIQYSRQKKWLPFKMSVQVPGLIVSIYREHQWLKKIVKSYSIDAVISDNRFGLYHAGIPSVYITHQLLIKTGNKFSEWLLMKLHYWFIKKYKECWVPDFEGAGNMAGQLSHPSLLPPNVKYIGGISRFEKSSSSGGKYDLLILLSGPEPQRTIFERELLVQLKEYRGKVLFVRGLPEGTLRLPNLRSEDSKIELKNHLSAKKLNDAIEQAKMIVSRSGYTTVMDLVKLQKRAILVPTPGQTEQEYLARYLMEQQLCYSAQQHEFLLHEVLEKAGSFSYLYLSLNMEQYKHLIKEFVLYIDKSSNKKE